MQQMVANLVGTLAASISFAVGQAVQFAQNRDVMPRSDQDCGTNQHRLLLSMFPEVETLLRKYHKAIAEKYAELSQKRKMHRDLQSEKNKHRQRAKEYKLVATLADFEEPSLKYDVEERGRNWKQRALRSVEGSFSTSRKLAQRPPACSNRR